MCDEASGRHPCFVHYFAPLGYDVLDLPSRNIVHYIPHSFVSLTDVTVFLFSSSLYFSLLLRLL